MSKDEHLYDIAKTISHESFIHGDFFSNDFMDDRSFNYSNVRGTISGSPHHYQVRRDYDNKRKSISRFSTLGYSFLKQMNKKYKVFDTNAELWKDMWWFQY